MLAVAGEGRLVFRADGVHVRGGDPGGRLRPTRRGDRRQRFQQKLCPLRPLVLQQGFQRLHPLGRFLRVGVEAEAGFGELVGVGVHGQSASGRGGEKGILGPAGVATRVNFSLVG